MGPLQRYRGTGRIASPPAVSPSAPLQAAAAAAAAAAHATCAAQSRLLTHTLHRCFSVTQAGKVKSQCPKVAPQEDKPKKLQGRAKKRIQYNKRFVNVVLVNGKRRANPAPPGKMG